MSVKELNKENAQETLSTSGKPVVVDFWAPWCGPCKMMGPVFEKMSEEFGGKAVFAKINVDESQELAVPYGVQGIPTIIILKDGKEVERIVGFNPDLLKEKINSHI
ncbi:thioredoxin [Candidatus Pacearchaeota archaeon]|jgi:thioredoxin 1|nr:thioredoxin [Candidatus Pacearchaeota archaeon]|tara:strand:- start:2417 stop:2734 length:318 start_codon:yes stop_codon:yes gene_type:complete